MNFIVEVPAFRVNQVTVVTCHTVPDPVTVHVPDPIVKVLVLDTFEVKPYKVRFLLFASNDPDVSENRFVFVWIISSVKVSDPFIRFISILAIHVFPADFRVFAPRHSNVI